MEAFWTGALAGYGIAIPVGAIAVLIVDIGIRRGLRPALFAGAGTASADLVYSTLAVIGGTTLTRSVERVGEELRWVSALVLVAIALRGLWSALGGKTEAALVVTGSGGLTTYARFLGLTIINPITVLYFAAVVIGLGLADGMDRWDGITFVAGAFLASLSWQTLLAVAGWKLGSRLSARARLLVSIAGYLLVAGLALAVVL